MKIVFLIALVFSLAAISYSQRGPSNTACLKPVPAGVVLNICTNERGMAAIPQPRLYIRVFSDGRVEYETNRTWDTLIKKEIRIKTEDVTEILRLAHAPDYQTAKDEYPAFNQAEDSSNETTVDFYGEPGAKKIVLRNFYASDRENKKHYPPSLIELMERADEIWRKANGLPRDIPSYTFCWLMHDREYLTGRRVQLYADMELGFDGGRYLHDPDCDRPEWGKMRTTERIGFGFDEKIFGKQRDVIGEMLAEKGFATYITRVRVKIEGVLRLETRRHKHNFEYRFDIERVISMDTIVLGYQGQLKPDHIYSDAIDHVNGRELRLSSPLKPLIHHAQRIEWTNEREFPALKRSGRKYLTFRVLSKKSRKAAKYSWRDVYTCEIIRIVEN